MDWRKLAYDLALSDGKVGEPEATLIEEAIRLAGAVGKDELEFLVKLKRAAEKVPRRFDRLVYDVMKRVVLLDGIINAAETHWLRRTVFADRVVSAIELECLEALRNEAKAICPEFEALYRDCTSSPEFSRT